MAKLTDQYPELVSMTHLDAREHPVLGTIIERQPLRDSPRRIAEKNHDAKRKYHEVTNATEAARVSERCEKEFAARLKRATPTTAHPGTVEKLEILAQRMRAGQQLWSDEDAQGS